MKQHRILPALAALALTAMFCGGTAPAQDVPDAAQATLQARTAQASSMETLVAEQSTPTPMPTATVPPMGGISGQVTQNVISPFVRVIAFQVGRDQYFTVDLKEDQTSYRIDDLPPGVYHVLGYTAPSQFATGAAAAYTRYVTCGMASSCTDHTLIDVEVQSGQVRPNADLLDIFQMPEYPRDPVALMNAMDNLATNSPAAGQAGSIAGRLMYPASSVPAMAIIAYKVGSPDEYYYVLTVAEQDTYQIDNLPEGSYHVVAYTLGGDGFPAGFAGGYTAAVPCGLSVDCTDHSLLPVQVNGGMVNDDITPGDFYAPEGTLPPYPLP